MSDISSGFNPFSTIDFPRRPFEVVLRWHDQGTSLSQDQEYRWSGPATDEAEAITLARHQAADDLWNVEQDAQATSFRVVERTGFMPIALEGNVRFLRTAGRDIA